MTPSTSSVSARAPPTRSAATNGTPTTAPTRRRPLGQEHPLDRCSRPRRTRAIRSARDALHEVQPGQPAPLPRLPAAAKSCGCSTTCPIPTLAPAHLDAWLAWASRSRLTAVRPARAHPARAPRRHPRRDPPRPLQRPPRRPQQQDPPDQPPRLRLPLRRPADRARLPLLRRHHDRTPAMNFTHNSTGAPDRPAALLSSRPRTSSAGSVALRRAPASSSPLPSTAGGPDPGRSSPHRRSADSSVVGRSSRGVGPPGTRGVTRHSSRRSSKGERDVPTQDLHRRGGAPDRLAGHHRPARGAVRVEQFHLIGRSPHDTLGEVRVSLGRSGP